MVSADAKFLTGKKVLITGAGSGIGKSCVIAFLEAGAEVLAVDSNAQSLSDLESQFKVKTLVADLSQPDKYFPSPLEIDILINNAGVQHVAPIEEFPIEQADQMFSLMLRTPFFLTQKVLPHMYSKKWGRIIGISSIHGHVASPNKSVYVTAKHGLEGLTKAIALEGGPHGVTANTIAPSYARTALVEKQIKSQAEINKLSETEVVQEVMLQPAAIKRLIEPEEIAQLALYLCGPYSDSITGSSFGIDNGWTAR
jgi:3-hydroxybutyrate dehydrogenase